MRHAGQVVSRSRIARAVWPAEPDDLTNLVDVHVSHLRKKIDRGGGAYLIETVRGRGFRLVIRTPAREDVQVRHKIGYYAPRG